MEITDAMLDQIWRRLTEHQDKAGDPVMWIEGALFRKDDPDQNTRDFLRFIFLASNE